MKLKYFLASACLIIAPKLYCFEQQYFGMPRARINDYSKLTPENYPEDQVNFKEIPEYYKLPGFKLNYELINKVYAMVLAARNGEHKIIEKYIKEGIDVNYVTFPFDPKVSKDPYYRAKEVIKAQEDHHLAIIHVDNYFKTFDKYRELKVGMPKCALDVAIIHGRIDILILLAENNASILNDTFDIPYWLAFYLPVESFKKLLQPQKNENEVIYRAKLTKLLDNLLDSSNRYIARPPYEISKSDLEHYYKKLEKFVEVLLKFGANPIKDDKLIFQNPILKKFYYKFVIESETGLPNELCNLIKEHEKRSI